MITMKLYCTLIGDEFSPSVVEKATGIIFDEKREKGEIGKIGRYKGKAVPYGSCTLRDQKNKEVVIDFLEEHLVLIKENGVDEIFLQLNVSYDSQCNFELDPDFMSRVAKLSITLSVTCYQES